MKATDSPAAISRTENGAFLSFTIVQFLFDGKFKSDSAPLPQRSTDRDADRIYAWSTAGVIPQKSENASTYYRRSPYGGVQVL